MISLFKINDPFRIVILLGLLLVCALPQIIIGIPALQPTLYHALLGEALQGGNTLYADVYDNTPPLAAGIYWIIHSLFGRSVVALQLISILLIAFQALLFGLLMNKKEVFDEKNYLTALFYGIFMLLSFDFLTLPPVLMAQTFLLLMLRNLFRMNETSSEQDVFMTAVYLGIASLFYLPCFVFLLVALIGSILFSSFTPRHLLLIIYGFILTIAVVLTYFFYFGTVESIVEQLITLEIPMRVYASVEELWWIMLIPSIFLIASFFKIFRDGRFIVYQSNTQLLMLFWLLAAFVTLFVTNEFAVYQLILFVPPLGFFMTHFILLTRRAILAEAYVWLLLVALIFVNYNSLYGIFSKLQMVSYKEIKLVTKENFRLANKKVLVLGDEIAYYQNNYCTVPFLNWQLSRQDFDNLNRYDALVRIASALSKNYPDVVVASPSLMKTLQQRIPLLRDEYFLQQEEGIFLRK